MRSHERWRALAALVVVPALVAGCGSSPSSPSAPTQLPAADQVLRVTLLAPCVPPDGNVLSLFPAVYSRVTVTRGTSEWVAKAASDRAGDVELRVQATDAAPGGSVKLAGTIRGAAKHMPEILANLPAWESTINFGTDGRTTVSGFALGAQSTTVNAGMDGVGAGDIILSNGSGATCRGASFSWTLAPPP